MRSGKLFAPPVLRTGKERERHATWLELFYDLVFVAAVAQLASALFADYTYPGMLRFCLLMVPVWWAWVGHTFYLTRFDTDDVGHQLLTMVQMIAVASLAVNVSRALGPASREFALSYAAIRGILVAEYLRAGRHVPAARPLTNRYAAGFGIAAALWLLSVALPPPYRFGLWGVGIVIDFLTPLTGGSIHVRFPPHHMHLPERFGLFVIIVIGEGVAGVVTGEGMGGLSPVSAISGVMGLIIAFALWWGYFEGARGAANRVVRSFEQVGRYQLWLYAHLPLVMGITATAVGVRRIIALAPFEPLPPPGAVLVSGAVGASCLSLAGLFIAAYPARRSREMRRFLVPYYVIALLGLATGVAGNSLPGVALLAVMMVLSIAQIAFSLRAIPQGEG
ncbi:MAG TPA: low temperature requirement protein A [Candidatus Deferrimicrobiaceae bacterium]